MIFHTSHAKLAKMSKMGANQDFSALAAPQQEAARAVSFYGALPPNLFHTIATHNFISAFFTPYEDVPHPKLPEKDYQLIQASRVIGQLETIWTQQGWIPLQDLVGQLIDLNAKELPEAKRDALKAQLACEIEQSENLTGFTRKAYGPMTFGLAHLFAIKTGKDVALISADFSNIGGLMKHLEGELNLAGTSKSAPSQAYQLADAIIQVCTGIGRTIIQEVRDNNSQTPAFRSGGDEFDFLAFGLPADNLPHVTAEIYKQIDEFLVTAGLGRFEYLKDTLFKDFRAGTGMGIACAMLTAQTDPGHLIHQLERDTTAAKLEQGELRAGRLSPLHVRPEHYEYSADQSPQKQADITLARQDYLIKAGQQAGLIPRHYDTLQAATTQQGLQPDTLELDVADARARAAHQHARKLAADSARIAQRFNEAAPTDESEAQRQQREARQQIAQLRAALVRPEYSRFIRQRSQYQDTQQATPTTDYSEPITHRIRQFEHQYGAFTALEAQSFRRIARAFEPLDPGTGLLMEESLAPHIARYAALDAQSSPEQPSQLLMLEFEGMRMFNDISHLHADFARGKIADIFREELEAAGISPAHAIFASKGNRLTALLPPAGALDVTGKSINMASTESLQKASERMVIRINGLNDLSLGKFFTHEAQDLPLAADQKAKKISEMADPRRFGIFGVSAVTQITAIERGLTGGEALEAARQAIEKVTDAARLRMQNAAAALRRAAAPAVH